MYIYMYIYICNIPYCFPTTWWAKQPEIGFFFLQLENYFECRVQNSAG